MPWLDYVAYFFGGLFFANALPHLLAGLSGKAFQSPFAKPPGQGLSSSTVNAVWGLANLAIAYALVLHVGQFDLRRLDHAATFGAGIALISVGLAGRFGRFNGGNKPGQPPG